MLKNQVFLPVINAVDYAIFITEMKNANNIIQLFENLQSFQIVQCQMHHEQVLTNSDENPMYNVLEDKHVFDRVKLCDSAIRNKRLGCAHSGANLNFERVLEQLETVLPKCSNQILEYKNEFQSVVSKIYALDHKVGHLEHDIAVCTLNFDIHGKDKLEQILHVLKLEHTTLMNLLSTIKTDIEKLIQPEVNYSNI
jgi:hypothetical protein